MILILDPAYIRAVEIRRDLLLWFEHTFYFVYIKEIKSFIIQSKLIRIVNSYRWILKIWAQDVQDVYWTSCAHLTLEAKNPDKSTIRENAGLQFYRFEHLLSRNPLLKVWVKQENQNSLELDTTHLTKPTAAYKTSRRPIAVKIYIALLFNLIWL